VVVFGLDVGYSNLKAVVGSPGERPQVFCRPAGAAPREHLGERFDGRSPADAVEVDIDGSVWVAGIEPMRLENWQRPLHEGYIDTATYRALVLAALGLAKQPVIDCLVTGLPVGQTYEGKRREQLQRALVGRHPTQDGSVEIGEVKVIPQPVGAFVDALFTADSSAVERMEAGTVLVLDAGYYSIDWALIVAGELRRGSSGTSLEAMSVLLERAAKALAGTYGGRPQPLALEAAIRAGRARVLHNGQSVALGPIIEKAAGAIAQAALESLRQALRRETINVDLILVTGGGGELYGHLAAAVFPNARLVVSENPVTANAQGFFFYGCQ